MEFDTYQRESQQTDRVPGKEGDSVIVPMLGLAGEAGELLSEYKKHLRDGDAHTLFTDSVAEELGDLLWYISNLASKFGLSLEDIAKKNIEKTQSRWLLGREDYEYFDQDFDEEEQLPRIADIEIESIDEAHVKILMNGRSVGAELTDNSYDPDGYRFHDVFHFAYAAVLGWSPVTRSIAKLKRRSNPLIDEVEDGGRAAVVEEGISALVFEYAAKHQMLEDVSRLDFGLLRIIQDMTIHLEVRKRTPAEWEDAILQGFSVWREVVANNGGRLRINMSDRKISYLGELS